ncbi:hypothetical protein [Spiroplasma ixodetis]|uniref:hypothetical protein n=1 Tax=Spiroplasma ixodetis TaxID=2141 RepID=UPI0025756980|nr:hypothetical protein [Spiroplasma ixodetis]WJG69604.1 hypothetical protein SIXOD_v1c05090 [Spiroplasma ixodetis Y32]
MSIPPAYKVVKWISFPQATTVVETEEAVPLLEVGEEGAIAIGEEVVEVVHLLWLKEGLLDELWVE